ncbi:MAG: hypothetical protein QM755_12775 [Luteolibacter sp.]
MDLSHSGSEILPQIRTIFGMVFGLSVAQLLGGIARIVQHPGKVKVWPVHLAWVLSTLLFVIHFWWWEMGITHVTEWNFARYLFLVTFASLFYFLSVLLLPAHMEEYSGFRDYFFSRKKWFFGVLATIHAADVVDTLAKGRDYFHSLGTEYPIRATVLTLLCVIAMFVKSPRFHACFVAAYFIYQVSWIARYY